MSVHRIGEEIKAPEPCTTFGFLSFIDPDYIVISGTKGFNDPDEYNNHTSIPIGCIRKVDIMT